MKVNARMKMALSVISLQLAMRMLGFVLLRLAQVLRVVRHLYAMKEFVKSVMTLCLDNNALQTRMIPIHVKNQVFAYKKVMMDFLEPL
jgi:hypothetical protein